MKTIRNFVFAVLAAAASVSAVSAQEVSGNLGDGTIERGKKTRAVVVLDIPSELHANSNKPKSEYLIPTTVKVTPVAGLRIGPVVYPAGIDKKFGFSENELNVYEGKVEFGFDVTPLKNFRGEKVSVEVAVRYQACNDEVCFPPKTKRVTLTAAIK
jgi:thioredoxin:protein disulfide reductase